MQWSRTVVSSLGECPFPAEGGQALKLLHVAWVPRDIGDVDFAVQPALKGPDPG